MRLCIHDTSAVCGSASTTISRGRAYSTREQHWRPIIRRFHTHLVGHFPKRGYLQFAQPICLDGSIDLYRRAWRHDMLFDPNWRAHACVYAHIDTHSPTHAGTAQSHSHTNTHTHTHARTHARARARIHVHRQSSTRELMRFKLSATAMFNFYNEDTCRTYYYKYYIKVER